MAREDAMSGGVTDEQRVAAFRDAWGREAFALSWRVLGQTPPKWEDLHAETRTYWGLLAEAFVAAWTGGQTGGGGDGG